MTEAIHLTEADPRLGVKDETGAIIRQPATDLFGAPVDRLNNTTKHLGARFFVSIPPLMVATAPELVLDAVTPEPTPNFGKPAKTGETTDKGGNG